MPKQQELSFEEQERREEFLCWVEAEMKARKMKPAHLADRGGISPGLVSMTFGRQLKTLYGEKFVRAVVLAFDLPETEVWQRAWLGGGD